MKKTAGFQLRLCILLGIVYGAVGCDFLFAPLYYWGSCGEDADLRTSHNYYEGATCVDGQAQCPDGRPFCRRIATFDDGQHLIHSCTGPCIECPNHGGACVFFNKDTLEMSYFCVESSRDCWSTAQYLPLDSITEGCPNQSPDCR